MNVLSVAAHDSALKESWVVFRKHSSFLPRWSSLDIGHWTLVVISGPGLTVSLSRAALVLGAQLTAHGTN